MRVRVVALGILGVAIAYHGLLQVRAEYRVWNAANGGFKTNAEFVELKGDTVRLRLPNGESRDVTLDKLSKADQDYAKLAAANQVKNGSEAYQKLLKAVNKAKTAEEALRLYRVFDNDPASSAQERERIRPALEEMRKLAAEKKVRMRGEWVDELEFLEVRERTNRLMREGLELLRLKQADQFRKRFAEASLAEPDSIRADFMLGYLYAVVGGDPTKAKQAFETCLKRDPENISVLNNLALASLRKGEAANAVNSWKKAATLEPSAPLVQNLGRFLELAGSGQIDAAKGVVDQAAETYATLLASGKFERTDLSRGWLWMMVDLDSLSLTPEDKSAAEKRQAAIPPPDESGASVIGGGTGFVVSPGYVLTNQHVIHKGSAFELQLNDGRRLRATLVAQSEKPDLALLKCPELDAKPLSFDLQPLRRGTDILTLGYPEMFALGASLKATRGVISAVPSTAVDDMYLYDAVVNQGNSGGPVFDRRGNVVAITTILVRTQSTYGGGIPSQAAATFLKKFLPQADLPSPLTKELDWPDVDQLASPSTVLVWTRSSQGKGSLPTRSAPYWEDVSCYGCVGLGVLKCASCTNGAVNVKVGNRTLRQACPICLGRALLSCPHCKESGVDAEVLRARQAQAERRNDEIVSEHPPRNPEDDPKNYPAIIPLPESFQSMVRNGKGVPSNTVGDGEMSFTDSGKSPGLLIGLDIVTGGNADGIESVVGVRPVFRVGSGRATGNWHGRPGPYVHLEAKHGYAVSGMRIKRGRNIHLLTLIYMKLQNAGFDVTDKYESRPIGSHNGTIEETIGNSTTLNMGIHGAVTPEKSDLRLGLLEIGRRKQ